MILLIDFHRLAGRPGNDATREIWMQRAELQREPVEWQARDTHLPTDLADQADVIESVAGIAAQPFDDWPCLHRTLARRDLDPRMRIHGTSLSSISAAAL